MVFKSACLACMEVDEVYSAFEMNTCNGHLSGIEPFSVMLKETFVIEISTDSNLNFVCGPCILKLSEAYLFRKEIIKNIEEIKQLTQLQLDYIEELSPCENDADDYEIESELDPENGSLRYYVNKNVPKPDTVNVEIAKDVNTKENYTNPELERKDNFHNGTIVSNVSDLPTDDQNSLKEFQEDTTKRKDTISNESSKISNNNEDNTDISSCNSILNFSNCNNQNGAQKDSNSPVTISNFNEKQNSDDNHCNSTVYVSSINSKSNINVDKYKSLISVSHSNNKNNNTKDVVKSKKVINEILIPVLYKDGEIIIDASVKKPVQDINKEKKKITIISNVVISGNNENGVNKNAAKVNSKCHKNEDVMMKNDIRIKDKSIDKQPDKNSKEFIVNGFGEAKPAIELTPVTFNKKANTIPKPILTKKTIETPLVENNQAFETTPKTVKTKKRIRFLDDFKIKAPKTGSSLASTFKIKPGQTHCEICTQKFESSKKLVEHMHSHYPNFGCTKCGKKFVSKSKLNRHMSSHLKGPFVCTICDELFENLNTRSGHVWRVHRTRLPYACSHCELRFRTFHQRLRHLKDVHGMTEKKYRCQYCEKTFYEQRSRWKHVRYTHFRYRKYKCSVCPMVFVQRRDIENHLATVHNIVEGKAREKHDKLSQCKICGERFKIKAVLKCHMKLHEFYDSAEAAASSKAQDQETVVYDNMPLDGNDTFYLEIQDVI